MTQKASKASADIAKNRLLLTITGRLSKKNLDRLYTDIRFCVADLQPGFDVITDLSGCTLASLTGVSTFRKITQFLITNRVGRVVRVIDDRKLVFRQLFNVAATMQGYRARYVTSTQEAEKWLDTSEKRLSPRFTLHLQPVHFVFNNQEAHATLSDISTGGCCLHSSTLPPAIDDTLELTFTFPPHEQLRTTFRLAGRVIWVKDDKFSVQFTSQDSPFEDELWERLVHESGRPLEPSPQPAAGHSR